MPYGKYPPRTRYGIKLRTSRTRYSRSSRTSRSAASQAARTGNKAVARKLQAPKVLKRTPPARNSAAIVTLARQVKGLQMTQNGSVQRAVQHFSFSPSEMPTAHHPVLFCLNNFYQDAVIVRGTTATIQGQADVGSFTSLGSWHQRNDGHVSSLHPMHKWDYRASLDTVSALQYCPLSSHLKMDIKLGNHKCLAPLKFRITFFVRKTTRNNDFASINDKLPLYAGAFRNMAHDDMSQRREFSPFLHKILYDKWIVIPPKQDLYRDLGPENTPVNAEIHHQTHRFISIPWKFDGKLLKPDLDRKAESSGDYAAETFYSNVPVSQQIWCCISSNMTPGANGHLGGGFTGITGSMQLQRSNVWRDKHGAATT